MPFDALALQVIAWCWFVNLSLNMFGYIGMRFPRFAEMDKPLDGGIIFLDGYRVLGTSTTWGGLLWILILGIIGIVLIPALPLITLAILVYIGHSLGSFIKRRFGIADGGYLAGIDHIDYLLVAGTFALLVGLIGYIELVIALMVTLICTPLITAAAFRLRLRSLPI